MKPGPLRERIRLDKATMTPDGRGGQVRAFIPGAVYRGRFIYAKGEEAAQRGAVTGTAVFKVRLRDEPEVRALSTADRLVDVGRTPNVALNVRDVDTWTELGWVWVGVEAGGPI